MNTRLGIILTYGVGIIVEIFFAIIFPIILSKHWIGPIEILISIIVCIVLIGLSIMLFLTTDFVKTIRKYYKED